MNAPGKPADEDRMLPPFLLLALAVLLLLGALAANSLRQRNALQAQLRHAQMQGRQAVDSRLHYYNLYKDLFALADGNGDAKAIVEKYRIQFNEPAAEPNASAP